jgi:hypothetical protein
LIELVKGLMAFWLAVPAAAIGIGAAQFYGKEWPKPNVVVTDSYSSPDSDSIKLLGVCEYSEQAVQCWDFHRRRIRPLEKQVIDRLSGGGKNGSPVEIRFYYRSKSRIAVFQASPFKPVQGRLCLFNFWNPDGDFFPTVGSPDRSGDPRFEYLNVETDPSTRSFPITAELTELVEPVFTLPCKEGASEVVGPVKLTIDSVKPVDAPTSDNQVHKKWAVQVSGIPNPPNTKVNLWVGVYDKSSRPVNASTNEGVPTVPHLAGGGPGGRNWGPRKPQDDEADALRGATVRTYQIGVDPQYIGHLLIAIGKRRFVLFKDVPLDYR